MMAVRVIRVGQLNAVRLTQLSIDAWPAVTCEACHSGSGCGPDDALAVDLSNDVIIPLSDVQVAGRIKSNLVGMFNDAFKVGAPSPLQRLWPFPAMVFALRVEVKPTDGS
jgi:hypothetical protein